MYVDFTSTKLSFQSNFVYEDSYVILNIMAKKLSLFFLARSADEVITAFRAWIMEHHVKAFFIRS